jgi:hypothetical protein
MRRMTVGAAVSAVAVSLTFAATALATPASPTFDQTYPMASALCVKAHAGTLPTRLEANKAAVITACDTLQNAFGPLVSTFDAANATFLGVVATEKGLVAAACPKPVPSSERAACRAARTTSVSAISAARTTRVTAAGTYHTSIEANRTTYWNSISSLRS